MKNPTCSKQAFTLIELLVVVMIIAILAAIAVPQYKRAVLKSRFSTVMPMAKSIADAQEVYYQGRQMYALGVDELDVTPVNAENTSVTLSQTDGYDYVMAQNSKVPGANYIIYQKYSENYPSEIHCEAADDNEDAQWLCGVLSNNNSIGKTITDGYTTYIINGTGAGIVPGAGNDSTNESGQTVVSCASAEAMGLSCNITTNEAGEQVKQVCANGFCRTKTYNEDGSYTSITCKSDGSNGEGVCTSDLKSITYDANGNQMSQRRCATLTADGSDCATYESGGNLDYTYDINGNQTSQRNCKTLSNDGTCDAYKASGSYDWTYDANGNRLTSRQCNSIDNEGNCTAYKASGSYDWTYDANGNQLTQRTCNSFDNSGNCTVYSTSNAFDWTYDANGNRIFQRLCSTLENDGTCSAYSSFSRMDYTYDTNGHLTSQRECNMVANDGTCSMYSTTYQHPYYTYDANGNRTSQRNCKTLVNDGTCSAYSSATDYIYDDNGKQIAYQSCSGSNINTTTGECLAYNSAYTISN